MSRPPATSFTDLLVWQKSHAVVLAVYALTGNFPRHELFGLTSQMRRASSSARYSRKAYLAEEVDEVSRMLSAYERTILLSVRAQTLRTLFVTSVFCVLSSVF